jgi:hypothetical protein
MRSIGNIAAYLLKGISGPGIATPRPTLRLRLRLDTTGKRNAGSNERAFVARLS